MKNYIVINAGKGTLTELAAKELRRYHYVLGEEMPLIVSEMPECGHCIIAARRGSKLLKGYESVLDYKGLGEEGYLIFSSGRENEPVILTGDTEISLLYAAYHFLELQGIRFYLHGDTIPEKISSDGIWHKKISQKEIPLFKERGIQPFHDFPEGPDWWNRDDYYAILTQLSKMRGNFFAMHTYPECDSAFLTAEPTVWIGKKEECNEDGTVKSSYPVQHFKTNGGSWGYHPMKTKDYPCGTGNLYDKDCYGAEYMTGYEEELYLDDVGKTDIPAQKYNEMFDRFGRLLGETFTYANKIGIKTCIGTEAPLTIPKAVKAREGIQGEPDEETLESLYEGIFERIKRAHPLDYYWMWTPEGWTWGGNTEEDTKKTLRDFSCALKAKEKAGAPFELAICGWTLGPKENRAAFDEYLPESMPFSCINRNVGVDPIEPKFRDLKKTRPSWAIPWLEDDPAMTIPQLWAGRMRRDAYDASRYGCEGLLGIHWRTSNIAPNAKALLEAAWEQPWKENLEEEMCLEGYTGEESWCEEYPEAEGVLSTARKGCLGYLLRIPLGTYDIRMVFQDSDSDLDVRVQGRILRDFKINHSNREMCVSNIAVDNTLSLRLEFIVKSGTPALAAIEVEGETSNNQLGGGRYFRKINCGGAKLEDYEADLKRYEKDDRFVSCDDFYKIFAEAEFGKEAGEKAAAIFAGQDGKLPRPAHWIDGPGNIYCNETLWEDIEDQYDFVEAFDKLETLIKGEGEKNRYLYWKHAFHVLKACGEIGCLWGQVEAHCKADDGEVALADYQKMLNAMEELEYHLLMGVKTTGDMGVITNIQQRSIVPILKNCKEKLNKWYPELPTLKENVVEKASRLVVPTIRTSLQSGEDFKLKVLVIGGCENVPVLSIRKMGSGKYQKYLPEKKVRWVCSFCVPASELKDDFEYHITLEEKGRRLQYPYGGAVSDQTVIYVD